MAYTVSDFYAKFPEAQFMGGDVILHVGSKNQVVARLIAEDTVVLTDDGKALLASTPEPAVESADTSTSAKKPKRKKAEVEEPSTDELDLDEL